MRIGIAYDTREMYEEVNQNGIHEDFASLEEVSSLQIALAEAGYDAVSLGNAQNILRSFNEQNELGCDLVLNIAEGINSRNREALVPALLEIAGIPYIGTDAYGLSLSLDKQTTKLLANQYGVLTPDSKYFTLQSTEKSIKQELLMLEFPVIIKPNWEGNSSGIAVRNDIEGAFKWIQKIFSEFNTPVLCETFIKGNEITVPLVWDGKSEDELFGITGIDCQKNDRFWLNTDMKMKEDYRNILVQEPEDQKERYRQVAHTMFQALGCQDFARFDFREAVDGRIYFIEANPLPALYPGGSFDVVGKLQGHSFSETMALLIHTGCTRLAGSFPEAEFGKK